MRRRIPTIAIVGRTNVGKSTLFNRLAGSRISIVEDVPGVTRDRAYALVQHYSFPFTVIDTGGLVGEEESPFTDVVRAQAELAIEEADLVIAMFDGLVGLNPRDAEVADHLRRSGKPVLWVVNKCEKDLTKAGAAEFYALGIDDFHCISAAAERGVKELVARAGKMLRVAEGSEDASAEEDEAGEVDRGIRVAIVGRPNVGKSTFVNRLLGEQRLVTSPVAGTTRDSIDVTVSFEGEPFTIVDTAGLRRKANVDDGSIERFANLRALRALSDCDVAVLLLDATDGVPSDQDKRIATLAHERGRGLIIAMNKWDLIEKDHKTAREFEKRVKESFRFTGYAPIIFISAESGKRCHSVLKKVRTVFHAAREHLQTSHVNRLFSDAFRQTPPPAVKGRSVRLLYAAQTDVAPPTFVLFVNNPRRIPDSYVRFLKSFLREQFPFEGTDVRLLLRKRQSEREV